MRENQMKINWIFRQHCECARENANSMSSFGGVILIPTIPHCRLLIDEFKWEIYMYIVSYSNWNIDKMKYTHIQLLMKSANTNGTSEVIYLKLEEKGTFTTGKKNRMEKDRMWLFTATTKGSWFTGPNRSELRMRIWDLKPGYSAPIGFEISQIRFWDAKFELEALNLDLKSSESREIDFWVNRERKRGRGGF